MNRIWIAKPSRAICPAIVGALVLAAWTSVQAAPLGIITLQGRKAGGDWSSNLIVAPGDVIEYRLQASQAPVGTTNGNNTITTHNGSGFNSLHFNITQQASAPIQVNFRPPLSDPTNLASFRNGWADGAGARPGTPTLRSGTTNNDILDIRPVHAPGVFTGAATPETVVELSTFNVATAPAGATTTLVPSWGTITGSIRINGTGSAFIQNGTTGHAQQSPDPMVQFNGLTLTAVPEPSTIALVGMGLIGLVAFARRRRAA
jgi:hypothetical protein